MSAVCSICDVKEVNSRGKWFVRSDCFAHEAVPSWLLVATLGTWDMGPPIGAERSVEMQGVHRSGDTAASRPSNC